MSAYTPVAIAGKDTQIRHVARLLAAQITVYNQGASGSRGTGYRVCGFSHSICHVLYFIGDELL